MGAGGGGGGGGAAAKEGASVLKAILEAEAKRREQRRQAQIVGQQRGSETIARSGELLTTGQLGALGQILASIRGSVRG